MDGISQRITNLLNAEMPALHTLDPWERLVAVPVDDASSSMVAEDNHLSVETVEATKEDCDRVASSRDTVSEGPVAGSAIAEGHIAELHDNLPLSHDPLSTCWDYCYQRTLYYQTPSDAEILARSPAAKLTKAQKRARAKREARCNRQKELLVEHEKEKEEQIREDEQGQGNVFEGLIKFCPLDTESCKFELDIRLLVKDHINLCHMATTYLSTDNEFEEGFENFIHPLLRTFFLIGQPLDSHLTEEQRRNSKVQLVFTGKDDYLSQGRLRLTHDSWKACADMDWFSLVDTNSKRKKITRADAAGVLVADTTLGGALDFLEYVESLEADCSEDTRVLMIHRRVGGVKFEYGGRLWTLEDCGQSGSEGYVTADTDIDTETSKSRGLSSDISVALSEDNTGVSELSSKSDADEHAADMR